MFTTWEQVRDWITDNNFPHWVFTKGNPEERDNRNNDVIIDSNNFTVSDLNDKLDMTEKYLRMYGGRCYGMGFKSPQAMTSGTICEVRLQPVVEQLPTQGVGGGYPSIGELTETITRQVRAEIEAENYKRDRDNFEKEKAEFEAEKQSAIGAMIHYFAPIGKMMLEKRVMRNVAGIDADAPVVADPIQPIVTREPEENESVFTDEEESEIYDLLSRFKKVEPDYLSLIRSVVEMAEKQDPTYNMAKGFLVK